MPTLALVIILAVMPMIIQMMAEKVEKQPTKSAVDFSLGTKYYCFQFFIIFFFNTIIGAASSGKASGDKMPIKSLYEQLKDDPGQITDWLADAIPQQARSSLLLTSIVKENSWQPHVWYIQPLLACGVNRHEHRRARQRTITPEFVLLSCRLASSSRTCSPRASWRGPLGSCVFLER